MIVAIVCRNQPEEFDDIVFEQAYDNIARREHAVGVGLCGPASNGEK